MSRIAIKFNGKNVRQLADEIAKIVGKSCTFAYRYTLQFEIEDAAEIIKVAEDAATYWKSIKKPSMVVAAETIRSAIAEVVITERARISWSS